MELVLMSEMVRFQEVNSGDYWIAEFHSEPKSIHRDKVTWPEGLNSVAREFISGLVFEPDKESELIEITLRNINPIYFPQMAHIPNPRDHDYELQLKHVGEANILETLGRRFRNKITILIRIDRHAEEMAIQTSASEDCKCRGAIKVDFDCVYVFRCEDCQDEFDSKEGLPSNYYTDFTALVKIIAKIRLSPDEIMAGTAVPTGKKILEQGLCSDLVILAMNGVQIPAHKCFLAASARALWEQFGIIWEKESKKEKLDLCHEPKEKIMSFLRCIYYCGLGISEPEGEIIAESETPEGKMILERNLFTDLTIVAMDGVEIPANKCFLSDASPVLRAQFGGNWEKHSKSCKLDMSDVSVEGVKAFLRYAYYHDLEEAKKDLEILYELFYIAHKYEVLLLETRVLSHFLDQKDEDFTVELAFTIYAFVRNIDDDGASELRTKTARILMSNAEEIETLSEFKKLQEENPNSASLLRREITDVAEGSAGGK